MKRLKALLIAACSIVVFTANTASGIANAESVQIVINEVCAKNTTYAAVDGKFYDWIELYNSTNSNIDLSGFGLSDKAEEPYLFTFPNGTFIASGERLLIFCDSKLKQLDGHLVAPFGLSTDGETLTLTNVDGKMADTITFGTIETDVSYGRVPDGSESFAILEMTPNSPNKMENVIDVKVQKPTLSKGSGFYNDAFSLSVSAQEGMKIYYTLDGSNPTTESNVYSSPINVSDVSSSPNVLSARTDVAPSTPTSSITAPFSPVDKAIVVRAVAVDSSGNFSDIVTETYFVGYQNKDSYYKNLKVISIVTDSKNLYDYENGIYVLGKAYDDWLNGHAYDPTVPEWFRPANYTQKGAEWEREASMQIFENGGTLAVNQNVGIRVRGGATRSYPQKSFNIYARSEYGASKLDFDLFSGNVYSEYTGQQITEFDSFMIRNGGNDAQYTRFRDKLNQSLVSDRNILTQAMEPCIVFIDGEYWGQYEITEKMDDDFIKAHYGVSKKDVCMIKNQLLEEGDTAGYDEWNQLRQWISATDFSNDENYVELCNKVDIQSFMDYVSAEIYINNCDWGGNNMSMWKSIKTDSSNPYADGKWRFILFDTEYSTNLYEQATPHTNSFTQFMKTDSFLSELLSGAMENESFKEKFSLTFMDMSNENFDNNKVQALITELSNSYHDTTIDAYNRFWPEWPGGHWAETQYSKEVENVKSFYNSRFPHATDSLKTFFNLRGNLANVTIKNDSSMGDVTINTISPEISNGSWSGKYYTDYPVTMTAKSKPGYQLAYWETSNGEKISGKSVEISFTSDITITAVYTVADTLIGDVNLDGELTAQDVTLLKRYLLGVEILTKEQAEQANVCEDENLNSFDLSELKRILFTQ